MSCSVGVECMLGGREGGEKEREREREKETIALR